MIKLLFKYIFNINPAFRKYLKDVKNYSLDLILNLTEEEQFKILNEYLDFKN